MTVWPGVPSCAAHVVDDHGAEVQACFVAQCGADLRYRCPRVKVPVQRRQASRIISQGNFVTAGPRAQCLASGQEGRQRRQVTLVPPRLLCSPGSWYETAEPCRPRHCSGWQFAAPGPGAGELEQAEVEGAVFVAGHR